MLRAFLATMLIQCWIASCSSPTYCVDIETYEIFAARTRLCLGSNTVMQELDALKSSSVAHFQRAHELLAFNYFYEAPNDSRRNCYDADFEYLPLLPMTWKAEISDDIMCTTAGICPKKEVTNEACTTASLVKTILDYMEYSDRRRNVRRPLPFIVSSGHNLKTVIGHGLPLAVRKGTAFDTISRFIESVFIGHYERIPQCADILRKSWRHAVEMPYIPLLSTGRLSSEGFSPLSADRASSLKQPAPLFLFSGRMKLYGSDRVCSTRVALLQLVNRSDTILVDVPEDQTIGPPIKSPQFYSLLTSSSFCLVTRSNSQTTAFFYEALQASCIPIVISDWFMFPFWWAIPYDEFVIRVKELDFQSDANRVLDFVKRTYNNDRILSMKTSMRKHSSILAFEQQSGRSFSFVQSSKKVILPFELLLLEMKAALDVLGKADSNQLQILRRDPKLNSSKICFNPLHCSGRVNPVQISSDALVDTRSHLCKHASRLIGAYKIVYFMQCVRMLWSLRPGLLKPVDMGQPSGSKLSDDEYLFVNRFHNLTPSPPDYRWELYPPQADEIYRQKNSNNILTFY
jgi:hypothetical protein